MCAKTSNMKGRDQNIEEVILNDKVSIRSIYAKNLDSPLQLQEETEVKLQDVLESENVGSFPSNQKEQEKQERKIRKRRIKKRAAQVSEERTFLKNLDEANENLNNAKPEVPLKSILKKTTNENVNTSHKKEEDTPKQKAVLAPPCAKCEMNPRSVIYLCCMTLLHCQSCHRDLETTICSRCRSTWLNHGYVGAKYF